MTEKEIGDAVAKACGWTYRGGPGFYDPSWKSWMSPEGVSAERPDFFGSVDACQVMHQHLKTESEMTDFVNQIYFLTHIPSRSNMDEGMVFASAQARCLAFLEAKRIIPWEDPK